ncbi:MAG: GcrA cell cycle regulator [Mesorhizobium sp.]|uniref:GcrA family cell cycle regulator n=1 Tax=Mesorhizobium sp. TaxID=1871066 RepID=UPI00120DDD86|nr:GcrA family cell cycle regulator [Mesorhizobium sp.]TJV51123.1 MAG: GcrA cell cycle regulator [Mesorhizobium sp.]
MSDLPDWKTISAAERDRLLADFCAQGLTARQISNNFYNCSRSAAIGRIHRLKLQLNGGAPRKGKVSRLAKTVDGKPAPKAKAPVRKASKLVQQTSSWRGTNNPVATDFKARAEQRAASPGLPAHLVAGEARRPIEAIGVPTSRNLKLVELTESTCKWPIGDPLAEDFGFCGNDSTETGPYCRYHSRLAYEPATIRQRASLRSAERLK